MVITRGVRPRLCWGWLVLLALTRTTCAQTVYSQTCCSVKLMESLGNVMIETENQLPEGRYCDMKISRLCSLDKVSLQIWSMVSEFQFRFKWSRTLDPDQSHVSSNVESIFALDGDGVLIEAGDKIGLHSPPRTKVPIPYEFRSDDRAYSFHISTEKYEEDHNFTSAVIDLDQIMWPRAFAPYIQFCKCHPNGQVCAPGMVFPLAPNNGRGPIVGPPGPPGPAGPPGAGYQGDDLPYVCELPDISREIAMTGNKLTSLEEQITDMRQQLNAIYNSNSVTGICPTGMIAGYYGVGSCYYFRKELATMAVAELMCLNDFDAHLVTIESEIEERFLRSEILKMGDQEAIGNPDSTVVDSFFISAMYNRQANGWIWYNEYSKRQPVLQYSNWRTIVPPVPTYGKNVDVCSTLNVEMSTTQSFWEKEVCNRYKFYICEVPKKCL